MRLENAVAADVLERILSAYGFTMQKELSDKLGIAKSNVASWLQRGQVPGNVLVQCALDTGADVQWLVTGMFANANMRVQQESPSYSLLNGQSLITKMLQSGGKPVLQRILEAYGFKTQKELSEHLGISTGTISTWIRREYFPGDVVITCALETKVDLDWLATGSSLIGADLVKSNEKTFTSETLTASKYYLDSGKLIYRGRIIIDESFIPFDYFPEKLKYVFSVSNSWLVSGSEQAITNGRWLLELDGVVDIYDVLRLPEGKLKISSNEGHFECRVVDVVFIGRVISMLSKIYK
ncbi:phage repressor protein CI [Rahnella aceris]|uniref:phage repressor protein CI n=1 Tax=Rahnella sp. (strain Y9602) TaxID=2703885 RepID=UPI003FD3E61E